MAADDSCAYEPAGTGEAHAPAPAVTYGATPRRSLEWDAGAEARLARIPSFVRGVVADRVEAYARRNGIQLVTPDLMTRVREELPVDFSRRRPFFLKRES